jgi:hypothetical protein
LRARSAVSPTPATASWRSLAATYEKELHPAWRRVIESVPELIVDVGAAEGTYLAGLARAVPDAHLVAFEAKLEWQDRVKLTLALNGVGARCEVRGFCDRTEFRRVLEEGVGRKAFVLMDIEGGEFELLDVEAIRLARDVSFIIELHERDGREAGEALADSFRASHEVEIVWEQEQPRSWRDVPDLKWRLAARLLPAINSRLAEGRGYRMRWLCAWARA